MTTNTDINNIADLLRILKEQPEWVQALRGALLSEELLSLPERLAEFVQATDRNFQLVHQRLDRLETDVAELKTDMGELKTAQTETNRRLGNLETSMGNLETSVGSLETSVGNLETRMGGLETSVGSLETRMGNLETSVGGLETSVGNLETSVGNLDAGFSSHTQQINQLRGQFSNFEGTQYERMVRTRALTRARSQMRMVSPYMALNQDGIVAPEFNRAISLALNNGAISEDESNDLHEVDLIISSSPDNRHLAIEVSISAGVSDIERAKRRAEILSAVTGGVVTPVVITSNLEPEQQRQADAAAVTIFIVPYP